MGVGGSERQLLTHCPRDPVDGGDFIREVLGMCRHNDVMK